MEYAFPAIATPKHLLLRSAEVFVLIADEEFGVEIVALPQRFALVVLLNLPGQRSFLSEIPHLLFIIAWIGFLRFVRIGRTLHR